MGATKKKPGNRGAAARERRARAALDALPADIREDVDHGQNTSDNPREAVGEDPVPLVPTPVPVGTAVLLDGVQGTVERTCDDCTLGVRLHGHEGLTWVLQHDLAVMGEAQRDCGTDVAAELSAEKGAALRVVDNLCGSRNGPGHVARQATVPVTTFVPVPRFDPSKGVQRRSEAKVGDTTPGPGDAPGPAAEPTAAELVRSPPRPGGLRSLFQEPSSFTLGAVVGWPSAMAPADAPADDGRGRAGCTGPAHVPSRAPLVVVYTPLPLDPVPFVADDVEIAPDQWAAQRRLGLRISKSKKKSSRRLHCGRPRSGRLAVRQAGGRIHQQSRSR